MFLSAWNLLTQNLPTGVRPETPSSPLVPVRPETPSSPLVPVRLETPSSPLVPVRPETSSLLWFL